MRDSSFKMKDILFFIQIFVSGIASLAQLAEQLIRNEQVGGSSPLRGSNFI